MDANGIKWQQPTTDRPVPLASGYFLNGELLPVETLRDSIKKSANVKVDHGGEFVIGQRFRARGLAGGLVDDVRLTSERFRPLTEGELRTMATGDPLPTLSFDYFVSAVDEKCRSCLRINLRKRGKAFVMAEEAMNEIPIMQRNQIADGQRTFWLAGQYDAPTDSTRVDKGLSQCP